MRTRKMTIWVVVAILCLLNAKTMAAIVYLDDGASHTIDDLTYQGDSVRLDSIIANNPGTHVDLVDGGEVIALNAYNNSTVTMSGGSIGENLLVRDSSQVTMLGGTAWGLNAYDNGQVTISGGTVTAATGAYGNSQITMSGGTMQQMIAVSGQITMSGGTVLNNLSAHDNGHVIWSGGTVGQITLARLSSTMLIVGSDFAIDGTPVGYGNITSILGGLVYNEPLRTLTGTLQNGDAIDNIFRIGANGSITLIPEPSTLEELEIVGPNKVAENFSASYKAISHYDNNSTKDVTDSADWQVEPNTIASIDDSGLLTTEDIDASEDITIYAQYTEGEITVEAEKEVSVLAICPSGSALSFDGSDDYVEVGDKSILDFAADDSFTLLAWIKSDKAISAIVGKRRSTGAGGVFKEGYNLGIYLGVIEFGVEDVSGNRTGILHSGATVLNDDTWHHVVAVRDTQTGELRAYVDGFVDAPAVTDSTTTTLATSKSFQIGRRDTTHHGSNPNYFGGIIDEVAIYDRALSAEEIQANMHTRLTGVEPGLVAYWDFDEGEGQITYDLSGNGNDGQLGSTPNPDNSDPAWAESDAPVGICTPVEVDIKPGSCPNPLNVASKGVLPVAILGSDTFDVTTIDAASIFLDGVPAIRSGYEDVAAPVSDANDCNCTEKGPDGFLDLTLKFRTQEIVEQLIDTPGGLVNGQTLGLNLSGALFDDRAIAGSDCVVLVGNVPRWLSAKKWDGNEDGVVNLFDLAEMAQYWLESSVVTD